MRILRLANKDLASNLALNYLFQSIQGQHQFQLLLSSTVGKPSQSKAQSLLDLAFFEQDLFNHILFPTLHKRPSLNTEKFHSFAGFEALGIEVSEIASINCRAGLNKVGEFAPDLIVSIRFGLILQSAIIDIPKFGVINLHSGVLPTYRGVMATFRAMQLGDSECGTTVHYIRDSSIDSGDIIAISKQSLDYQRSYVYNTVALYQSGIKNVIDAIANIEKTGQCTSYSAHSEGNYFSFPSEKELKDFQQKGLKLYEYRDVIEMAKNYLG